MVEVCRPDNAHSLAECVAECVEARRSIAVRGAGTSRLSIEADSILDLSLHHGLIDYDPEELVISVRSGTSLAEIQALLEERQQMLAFDPVDPMTIGGGAPGGTTIGGVIASGNEGPRRVSAGAARDHLLGFTAISGRGDHFKAGGRVVKNVTGFDLAKLFTGSWGTLGVFDIVTLRVLPLPRFEATLVIRCDCRRGGRLMAAALRHAATVSCAAWHNGRAMLRLEGFRPSVEARIDQLVRALGCHAAELADSADSVALWDEVRTVSPIAATDALWRASLPTTEGAAFVEPFLAEGASVLLDWGGARVWLGVGDEGDAAADVVHRRVMALGGHARLVRASPAVRKQAPPAADAVTAKLNARLRDAFDPHRLLNPGLDPWER